MRLYLKFTSSRPARSERGDVPGWVMITVMTIVIASALMVAFQDRVTGFLDEALGQMKL